MTSLAAAGLAMVGALLCSVAYASHWGRLGLAIVGFLGWLAAVAGYLRSDRAEIRFERLKDLYRGKARL